MNWRSTPPRRRDYETDEEYDEAVDLFYEALEADWEERYAKERERI